MKKICICFIGFVNFQFGRFWGQKRVSGGGTQWEGPVGEPPPPVPQRCKKRVFFACFPVDRSPSIRGGGKRLSDDLVPSQRQ